MWANLELNEPKFTTNWGLYNSEEILRTSIGEVTKDIGSRFIEDFSEKPSCQFFNNPKHDKFKCKLCNNIEGEFEDEYYEFTKESEGSLCDRRMGPRHKKELCATCKETLSECRGHFMHITLAEPIITDELLPMVYKLLLRRNKKLCMDRTYNRFYIPRKNKKSVIIMPKKLLPEYDKYVLQHLIVVPNCARPYEPFKKNEWRANDLTTLYADILTANIELRQNSHNKIVKDTKYLELLNAVRFFYNTGKKYTIFSNMRQLCSGIKQRIDGNEGRVKGNIIGTRCNYIARTVISPDITLKVDEVGLPARFCDTLTTPEYVTSLNIERLQEEIRLMPKDYSNDEYYKRMLKHEMTGEAAPSDTNSRYKWLLSVNGMGMPLAPRDRLRVHELSTGECFELKYLNKKSEIPKLKIGDIIHRNLENGDLVIVNRQPSLHKGSMMAMKVRRVFGDTIRLPLSVCPLFNADFDGDEMNVHVPQTFDAKADAEELLQIKNNILSCQSNKVMVRLIYDAVLGIYEITKPTVILNKHIIGDVCCWINRWDITTTDEWIVTGLDFIYFLLPQNGKYFKDLLGDGLKPLSNSAVNKIVQRLYYEYGGDSVIEFLSNVQYLTNHWMSFQGYSTHILDSCPQPDMPVRLRNPDLSDKKTELQKLAYLNQLRDSYRMNKDLTEKNGLIRMVVAGSKGNEINVIQASYMLGQQAMNGRRLKSFDGKRLMPHFDPNAKEPEAIEGGYVSNNFFEGLTVMQNFLHGIVGRSGVADTTVLTPETGYLEKQLCDKLRNVKVHHDGTVRANNFHIIQRKYGGDGYLAEFIDSDTNKVYYLSPAFLKRCLERGFTQCTYYSSVEEQAQDVLYRFKTLQPFIIHPLVPREFYDEVERKLNEATACAGTYVGVLAAHSVSEPATQLSLNTIHSTGISSKAAAITGFPRMKQLTQCSEKTVFLIIGEDDPPLECESTIENCFECFLFDTHYKKPLAERWELRYMGAFHSNKIVCETDKKFMVELRQKKYIDPAICEKLLSSLSGYGQNFRHSNYKYEDLHIRIYFDDFKRADLELKRLKKIVLFGIPGVLEAHSAIEYNIGEYKEFTTACVYKQVLMTHPNCKTNSVRLVNETFGIEACAKFLTKELGVIITQNGNISPRHYQLLVDVMCYSGKPQSILKIDMSDPSSLSRASFQKSTEMFLYGAVNEQTDPQTSVVSKIAFGRRLDQDLTETFIDWEVYERCCPGLKNF